MTLEKATNALINDPHALFFAGRDFDGIATSLSGVVEVATKVADVRNQLAGMEDPERLMLLRNATAELVDIAAQKETERTDGDAVRKAIAAEARRAEHQRQTDDARRHRHHCATHPTFCSLKGQIAEYERAILKAITEDDFAVAATTFAVAVKGAQTALAAVAKTLTAAA